MDALRPATRWWRFLLLTLALASACWPAEALALSSRADEEHAEKAQAQLDFRIVIPERLTLPTLQAPPERTRQLVTRTVEQLPDRTIITVAMP